MTRTPGVEWFEGVGPVSWETLIDAGLGTPEMIAWDRTNDADRLARWAALPWHVRLWRRLRPRWAEARRRFGHAARALRGIECEP
jgi:hypothetical protein